MADSGLGRVRSANEAGLATVWAVAWMTVCAAFAIVIAAAAVATARQHAVDSAADLAALSGAAAIQHSADGCAAAELAARSNRARLRACHVKGDDIALEVDAQVTLLGLRFRLNSESHAGPADSARQP
jgi:secretion/DNA translocation related TadE-like protein